MPLQKHVEVYGYENVSIDNDEIIEQLEEKDAKIVIEGLMRKFPLLADNIIGFSKSTGKLYPKGLQSQLEQKYKKENKSITSF